MSLTASELCMGKDSTSIPVEGLIDSMDDMQESMYLQYKEFCQPQSFPTFVSQYRLLASDPRLRL